VVDALDISWEQRIELDRSPSGSMLARSNGHERDDVEHQHADEGPIPSLTNDATVASPLPWLQPESFRRGDTVVLADLTRTPELNGKVSARIALHFMD